MNKYLQIESAFPWRASCRPLLLILLLLSSPALLAQKGKILGKVTDDKTGEPLPGATVVIAGTANGTVADGRGSYYFISLTPGTYTLTASMLGYGTVTIKGITVFIDRTTEINFQLKDEALQVGTVEITAQRPKIIKDQTSSGTTLDDAQITAAPVDGLRGAMDFSSSFQKNDKGEYMVRGSATNEVNFQVNGIDQGNANSSIPAWGGGAQKVNNSWKYDVNPLGVQQVQLISGGFSAEYGNAQAAVVKVVMKEGTPKFTGEFRLEYRPAGQYHYGSYIYSPENFEWQTWGSREYWLSQKQVALAGGANIFAQLGMNARFPDLFAKVFLTKNASAAELMLWDSLATQEALWAHSQWVRLHTPAEDNPLGVYDYRTHAYSRLMFGFGGPLSKNPDLLRFYFSGEYKKNPTRLPTPEKDQVYQNYIANFTSTALGNNKFKLLLSMQQYRGGLFSGSDDIRWSGLANITTSYKYFINRDPVRTEQTTTQSLNWVATLSGNSFFETTVSHQYEKYELPYKALLTWYDENDRLDGSTDSTGTLLNRGDWWDQTYFTAYENIATDFFQDSRSHAYALTSDFTSQVTGGHLLKAGAKLSYWELVNTAVTYNHKANAFISQQGVAEHYQAYPFNAALYVQDKMEYEGMIANIGLRAEAYNFQVMVPNDIFSVFYPGTLGPGKLGSLSAAPSITRYMLLPRLGISFPIGEATALRMQYGHFASMPAFNQALSNSTFYGWSARGNANLQPKKTINYELGVQQLLDEDTRLDVAVFYNDRVTQIGTTNVAAYTGDARQNAGFANDNSPLFFYDFWSNNLFGATIGTEITLESVGKQPLSYRVSYSLSQTTEGFYGTPDLYPGNASVNMRRVTTLEYTSPWDRTHNLRALVQYAFAEDEGPRLFGEPLLANTVISLSYMLQSGTPYTYITSFDVQDVLYNRRYPLESSWDVNLLRNVTLGSLRLLFGVRVMNVFDNRWLTPMESTQEAPDRERWIQYGVTIDQPDNPAKRALKLYPFRAFRNLPRQVFFTFGLGL